jgi:ATP-dependent helicase/nuclease subunit A
MTKNNGRIPELEQDRRRAVEETESSFIVEASAGTGKTRTLIDRILQLVLVKGPKGPPLRLQEICAITFTEKAAGEMKLRLRQHFQQILSEEGHSTDRLEKARLALDDLESASISTFHSFAVSLLKERPIEAGLDPHFTALNEIQSELFFRKVWEPWIGRALDERHPVLEKALRNSFRLQYLEDLARMMRMKWLTVRDLPCDKPPTEEQLLQRIPQLQQQGKTFLGKVLDPKDKLAGRLESALNWLESPGEDRYEVKKSGNVGAAGNWADGKDTIASVRAFIGHVVEFRDALTSLPKQQLLYDVVCWIKDDFMLSEWESRKRAGGLLDFDDQLRLACDLLQNPAVRRECLRQYKTLLVDEFQDTDSVQWKIVLLLTSPDYDEADSARLKPEPGRLFIVGDPKQSIYRFRNADIETYLEVADAKQRESMGMDLLALTTNFRSVPSILHFVDDTFGHVMESSGNGRRYQQDYLPFGENGYRKAASESPAVHILGDIFEEEETKRKSREFLELESRRIAALIRRIHGSQEWKIRDSSSGEGDGLRPPRYGDIAILLPVLTHADILEEALRDCNIPYVLEGGKFYYARSEVSSAITVLRAVANPNDRVALYGALRSIFFGLSDEDLLRVKVDGQELDYRIPVPEDSVLFHPFDILAELHRHRHERRASETFETLLQKTGAREVLAARGFQSLANLYKLGRTLRQLQGDATFSQVVDLLGMMDEEALAESESRLMEERSDAVRVMSIHKAKGLDFPILFVAALGVEKKNRGQNLLADPHGEKVFALSVGSKDLALRTTSWSELAEEEKKKDEAELVRLLYVALTRARDHMILSTHTAGWKKIDNTELWMPNVGKTRLKPLGTILAKCYSGQFDSIRWIDTGALDTMGMPGKAGPTEALPDWKAVLDREYSELRTCIPDMSSSGDSKSAGLQEDAPDAETAGKRSVRLGVAFHAAMERVDLLEPDYGAEYLGDLAVLHRLDSESRHLIGEMIHTTLSSELMQRARASLQSGRKVLRELPFVRAMDATTVEEGKIDLLFEEEDGWVLVDYKTDQPQKSGEEGEKYFREQYAAQIQGYAAALQALSVNVKCAYLLMTRTGQPIQII